MSKIIAMSQPAVTERLRKLEDQGIVTAYRAQLSPQKLGKHTSAFVMFKTNCCPDFVNFCEASPEIIDLYRISGDYNFLLKVLTEINRNHWHSFLTLAALMDFQRLQLYSRRHLKTKVLYLVRCN
jgi:DNA-binding Lrp family transcriptional regulator